MTQPDPIIILGGRSVVTPYLVKQLDAQKLHASVVSPQRTPLPEDFTHVPAILLQSKAWKAPDKAIVISLLPLSELTCHLPRLAQAQSIIALSSTCRFSKANSHDPYERALAENLEMSENILRSWCLRNKTVYTILRPTLVYDGRHDETITRIARVIIRTKLFPIAGSAKGLRQPIHAEDVAKAIVGALGNITVYNKALNIAGGQVLTYKNMVENIFHAVGKQPRFLPLPTFAAQNIYRLAAKFKLVNEKITPETFKRMNQDIVFDIDESLRLLGYAPRKFEPILKVS